MTDAITLGTVLGGRYKVTEHVTDTAAQDHVLDGRDQVLGRQVSILVAGPDHADLLISNARDVATGSRPDHLQILDLGQSDELTYLITSHTPAQELLDLLLSTAEQADDPEALGSDIFGDEIGPPETGEDYEQVTSRENPEQTAEEGSDTPPAVIPWTPEDYASYEDQPLPQRQAPRSGRAGGTLFDRAATDAVGGTVGASADSLRAQGDASYDGDNHYDHSSSPQEPGRPSLDDWDPPEDPWDEDEGIWEEVEDQSHETAAGRRSRPSTGLWITALIVVILLALVVFLGFQQLSSMISSFSDPDSGGTVKQVAGSSQTTEDPQDRQQSSPTAQESDQKAVDPQLGELIRVVPDNPNFMANGDATLNQAIDDNPQTTWLSYGFSGPQFGNLISGFGLAGHLQEPAKVSSVTINQQGASGGAFTLYVADSPTLDGAIEAGHGSFTGEEVTVELTEQAQQQKASYVIMFITEAPRLAQPIGGYPYGVRIAEISVD